MSRLSWKGREKPRPRWGQQGYILEPLILLLLAEEPAHDYRLAERLSDDFAIAGVAQQTIYRILQTLEAKSHIIAIWNAKESQGPPRKVYRLTAEGEEILRAWGDEMTALKTTLVAFTERHQHLFPG